MKRITKYTSMLLLGATLVGCATSAITGRKYLKLVDSQTINNQAALAYKDFLSKNSSKVETGSAAATQVKRVGNRIAAATNEYLRQIGAADKFNFNWEFNLIESDQVNAWCMPGGKVAVYTGILPVAKNDAGLATVMGHEIAHAIEEHSVSQVSNAMAAQLGAQLLNAAGTISNSRYTGIFNQIYGIGYQVGSLKFSRNDELAADKAGLILMAMAGYNPEEAVSFWERMAQGKKGSTPEWLSTHPSDARRISQLQAMVPEAMKYYKKQ
ncbi:M48 family metallopeptidase [Sphingobacterium endophyticum]|uniref:M48 family metallopeptidase n=1 Tax=Sphingobacterium endophyticum TaxID=2546448 RepID=UPI0012E2649D|nr:M48 family metallopeptidase [Sphingobacterium endophyticum]